MFVLTMAIHAEEGHCADKIHAVSGCDHALPVLQCLFVLIQNLLTSLPHE